MSVSLNNALFKILGFFKRSQQKIPGEDPNIIPVKLLFPVRVKVAGNLWKLCCAPAVQTPRRGWTDAAATEAPQLNTFYCNVERQGCDMGHDPSWAYSGEPCVFSLFFMRVQRLCFDRITEIIY